MKIFVFLLLILNVHGVLANPSTNGLKDLEAVHYNESHAEQKIIKSQKYVPKAKYVFVLFFSNQCPHCVAFAPVIQEYAHENHIPIESISLNGQTLPQFPHALFATQEMIDVAYQGKPVVYPALFLANTQNHALYPVAFGELSYPELSERMSQVKEKVVAYEEKRS